MFLGGENMILWSVWGEIREVFLLIDAVSYSLIDNIYNLLMEFATQEIVNADIVKNVMKNMYVLVGIFALFRIALFLVNAMINPDTLTEKGKGVSAVFRNLVIMLVLLFLTPSLFSASRDLTEKILKNNVITHLFVKVGDSSSTNTGSPNTGKDLQRIIVSSIIHIDSELSETDVSTYEPDAWGNVSCTNAGDNMGNCREAATCLYNIYNARDGSCWSNEDGVLWSDLADVNSKKTDGVYDLYYRPFLLTVVGWFITWILLSFTFDVGKRVFELAFFEMTAPLFIATIVEPNSFQDGPFKRWLKAVGNSYVSLFIRIAIIALIILFCRIVQNIDLSQIKIGAIGKIILLLAGLMFLKQAPQMITGLIGIDKEGSGIGSLGIGKKLSDAALIGGGVAAARKAIGGKAKEIGKNHVAKRKKQLGNAADRAIGGLGARNQARKAYKAANEKPEGSFFSKDARERRKNIRDAGRSAASAKAAEIKSVQSTDPANDFRWFKDTRDKYAAGQKAVNPNYETKRESELRALNAEAQLKLKNAGMDSVSMSKKIKDAKDEALTHDLYGMSAKSDKVYNPRNYEQMSNSFSSVLGHRAVGDDDYWKASYIRSIGGASLDSSGNVLNSDGNVIKNAAEITSGVKSYMNNANPYLKATIEVNAFQSQIDYQNEYAGMSENLKASQEKLKKALVERDQFLSAHPEPRLNEIQAPDRTSMSDEQFKLAMEKYVEDTTKAREEYQKSHAEWEKNTGVFESTIAATQKAVDSYTAEMKKYEKTFNDSFLLPDEKGDTHGEYNDKGELVVDLAGLDRDDVVYINNRYMTKYGEFEADENNPGKYIFNKKDMSDDYELITSMLDDKMSGPKYKGKLETVKEQYSIESKKVEENSK